MGTNIASSFTLAATPMMVDLREEEETEFQVTGLSGGDTIAVTRSFDKVGFAPMMVFNGVFDSFTSIAADHIYSCPAAGYLTFTKTGTASTPTISVRRGF